MSEKNEKLIEEAAKAIYETSVDLKFEEADEWNREITREEARAALAVFEKAHTPTDDERTQAELDSERLRQIAEWLWMEQGHEETAKRVSLIADRHDALALRSPVQGEPAEHFHIWSDLPCKAGECRMEPQSEPTAVPEPTAVMKRDFMAGLRGEADG